MVLMTKNENVKTTEQKPKKIILEIRYKNKEYDAFLGIGNVERTLYFYKKPIDKEDAERVYNEMVKILGQPLVRKMFDFPEEGYGSNEWEWWI